MMMMDDDGNDYDDIDDDGDIDIVDDDDDILITIINYFCSL